MSDIKQIGIVCLAVCILFTGCAADPLKVKEESMILRDPKLAIPRVKAMGAARAIGIVTLGEYTFSAAAVTPDGKFLTAWAPFASRTTVNRRKNDDGLWEAVYSVNTGFSVAYQDTTASSPKVLCFCPYQNLALLDAGIDTPHYLKIDEQGPESRQTVYALGAEGGASSASRGTVAGYFDVDEESIYLIITAPVFNGDIGGAVVSGEGKLLGIITDSLSEKVMTRDKLTGAVKEVLLSAAVLTPPKVVSFILENRPALPVAQVSTGQESEESPRACWNSLELKTYPDQLIPFERRDSAVYMTKRLWQKVEEVFQPGKQK